MCAIQPLNEPLTPLMFGRDISWTDLGLTRVYKPETPEMVEGSALISVEFLRDFYVKAYRRIRKYLAEEKYFVFHDAFDMTAWKDFMQEEEFKNVILDTHIYFQALERRGCEKNPESYVRVLREDISRKIEEMSQYFQVICGEWCVSNAYAESVSSEEERNAVYRMLAKEQVTAWEKGAGFFYWSYKLILEEEELDCWDFGKMVSHDWFSIE